MNMPEMDGFAFIEAVHDELGPSSVPFVILTSSHRDNDAERFRELGVNTYLLKPVKQSRILDAIVTTVGIEPIAEKHDPLIKDSTATVVETRPLHILVAEDNEVNQRFAMRALKKAGHTATLVSNGREAVEAFEKEAFDIVLMDVQMPEMDGYEATAAIRERERTTGAHIPIVALTAHAMTGDKEKCLAAGMDGHVTKPIKSKVLLAEMANVIEQLSTTE